MRDVGIEGSKKGRHVGGGVGRHKDRHVGRVRRERRERRKRTSIFSRSMGREVWIYIYGSVCLEVWRVG